MKIQGLAIIFVIIILPITIIIGEYAGTQIELLKKEQIYDSRLVTATHDSLKAFQINTFNDATSDIADSKIESIEASANAFYNSIETSFGLEGYSKEDLQMYVPALVYTMYDGYYIYSPYMNVADIVEKEGENTGNELDENYIEKELAIKLDTNQIDYGFKPYVYYSYRYNDNVDIDIIINYSLDNYITIQGIVDGEWIYKSGYLLTIDTENGLRKNVENGSETYSYNGYTILPEGSLVDNLVEKDVNGDIRKKQYRYIKLNGTKYYWNDVEGDEYIFYLMGTQRVKQVTKATNEELYNKYVTQIESNTSAINYYKNAYEFSSWVKQKLGHLTLGDAEEGLQYSGRENDKIFILDDDRRPIEYASSNFNLHKKEVIRYSIESNLSVAIANFNNYTNSGTNFQMPKLKETEWEMLQNEVSIISFLQGLNMGGKIYNGYTVVTNDKTEEVVKEERIYITTDDNGDMIPDYYHKVNDKEFETYYSDYHTDDDILLGVLDLDFETRKDGGTGRYYIQKTGLGCYSSIVGQEKVDNTYDSIYEYLRNLEDEDLVVKKVKQLYYTALGRERWGTYKIENPSSIVTILNNMKPGEAEDDELPNIESEYSEPEITIESTIEPNAYISPSQKPTIKANITITCESTMSKAQYIFTNSSIEPTEGWQNITISEDGKTAYIEVSKEVAEAGTWYLYVKAFSGTLESSIIRPFDILEQDNPPEITIHNADGVTGNTYQIPSDGSSITIAKRISATDDGEVSSLKCIYSTSSTMPDDSADWNDALWSSVLTKTVTTPGTYYLHVKALDNNGNESTVTKEYKVEKEVNEIKITIEDTDGETTYTVTEQATATMKKFIRVEGSIGGSIYYAWSQSSTTPTTGWSACSNTHSVTKELTTSDVGMWYLHVKTNNSEGQLVTNYKSWLCKKGITIEDTDGKTSYTVYRGVTGSMQKLIRVEVSGTAKIEYAWSQSSTIPTTGWTTCSNSASVTKSLTGADIGTIYLHVRVTKSNGEVINDYKSWTCTG